MKRIILFIFSVFCLSAAANAQMAPDLDTLGNVWIVTIDNSGSMRDMPGYEGKAPVSAVVSTVVANLKKQDFYDAIDFKHDRFIFYSSGLSYDESIGHGNEMAVMPDLDTSFIHHTDSSFHRLKDRKALIDHIHGLMNNAVKNKEAFNHDLSFVSQIRTFSVVKTIKLLKETGQNMDFNTLKLITITDDADQNDQWRTDYRNLSVGDRLTKGRKPISQRTRETIEKYVFNELTGVGEGVFRQIFADEKSFHHTWLYEYVSRDSMSDTLRRNVLRVDARDGKRMAFVPRHLYFEEDSLCFYGVDSVVVNGVAHQIGENFNERYEASFPYRNGLRFNDVKVYGSVQFKYDDAIYGPHYKKVRFVQEQSVPSGFWVVVFTLLGIIAGALGAGYLIYRFLLLPRSVIAGLYSGNGSEVEVKRGFRYQWKNEVIPVVHYETDGDSIRNVLIRKCRNVISGAAAGGYGGKDLLICSRYRLNVSEVDLEHNSMEDLDMHYACQTGNYPDLLRDRYRKTAISRMRARLNSSSNPAVRWWCSSVISALNRWCNEYYYYFHDISRYDSICFESPALLTDKKFIAESESVLERASSDIEKMIVDKALTIYYNDPQVASYDALLCYDVYCGKEYWNIIQLDDPTVLHNSLKSAFVVYRYVKDADEANRLVNQKMLMDYARKSMRRYSIGVLNCAGVNVNEIIRFNITAVPVPGFISMIEATRKPKAMLLYSPFKDGFIKYKYVSLKTRYLDGHLYLSFLPYKYVKADPELSDAGYDQMLRQLSAEVIRTNDWTSGKMIFENDKVSYKGIRADLKF